MTVGPSTTPSSPAWSAPEGNQRSCDERHNAMSPTQPPADAPQARSRHSTFRRRAYFAVPVVLVAAIGAGCEHEQTTNNPPNPVPPTYGAPNPPPPNTAFNMPTEQITTTSIVTGAPGPGPASTFMANPPSPSTSTTLIISVNPPPP